MRLLYSKVALSLRSLYGRRKLGGGGEFTMQVPAVPGRETCGRRDSPLRPLQARPRFGWRLQQRLRFPSRMDPSTSAGLGVPGPGF